MKHIADHLSILGNKVKDRVTGFQGVCTHVGFDLYGCIQCIVHPPVDKDGKQMDSVWFDISRLESVGEKAMNAPDFTVYNDLSLGFKGPSDKPKKGPCG